MRRKFRNVVPGARTGCQKLRAAAPKAVQHGLGPDAGRIRHLVALVKDKAQLLTVHPHPPLNLTAVFTELVQRDKDEVATADPLKIRKPFYENIGQAVVWQHHVPVVAYGNGAGHYPGVMDVFPFHSVLPKGNAGQRLTAALLPLKQAIPLLQHKI